MSKVRPLNNRVAEAMRRERLGLVRPLWRDWPDDQKAEWLSRADHLLRILKEIDVLVAINGGTKNGR